MIDLSSRRVVVLGAGPGGYPAAFLAADLGMDVTLVDPAVSPGGVCLYRGCIPSKTLLHIARVLYESREVSEWGITFAEPQIDLEKLRAWKDRVVSKLTGGLGSLSRKRRVRALQGRGRFADARTVVVKRQDGTEERVGFDYAIVATGSRPSVVPGLSADSPRVMNSTGALALADVPKSLLVVGGGYIGLELGTVYAALGSKVTVVEMTKSLLAGVDRDLVAPLEQRLGRIFEGILVETRVARLEVKDDGVHVKLVGLDLKDPDRVYDKALIAVGRKPNSNDIGLEQTAVKVDAKGFIETDSQRRTAEPAIFAIGDVAGEPMLAHKATHEARVAVEAIAGKPSSFDPQAIPAVVFTDPEIAWCGLTETQALTQGRPHRVTRFPWVASGRATTLGRNEGLTKLILDPRTERVLGVGIVGVSAGEMIAEGVLAVEMGARATDLKMTIHAHPTMSESVMEAAEVFFGHSPHLYVAKADTR
jgi:dihydrolipoamide dehydrogenase